MRLLHLSLQQFRSYEQLDLPLGAADLHLFVGPNAAGKTNLLEALAVLSTGRSCLSMEEDDLLRWGREFYRLRAAIRADAGEEWSLEVVSQNTPRRARACFVNDVRVPVGQLIGALPTVLFLPQDLNLFVGPPARRRSLLNDLLAQISPAFAHRLGAYEKVLKQRNALLRKIGEGVGHVEDLAVWDGALARDGAFLTVHHLELLKVLQCTMEEELSTLGESWHGVQLVYDRQGNALTEEGIAGELREQLRHFLERDLQMAATTVGPHRHDWRIDVDGRSLTTFASRGQQRTAVLALLFLQVSYVEIRRNEKPVVLLDDVFSELDNEHQERLLQSLGGHQVLLTATHLPVVRTNACVYRVGEGKVCSEEAIALARK